MKHGSIIIAASLLLFSFAWPSQAKIVVTNSQDCSVIDTTDGTTEDWDNVAPLKKDAATVDGTVYYFENDEWTTTKPENPGISVNPDQWTDITLMKMCTTADDMFMMMENTWPMMTYKENGKYADWWYSTNELGNGLTMPVNWRYSMVWKMQNATGEGNIIYFVADISIDKEEDFTQNEDFPTLWLYEEVNPEVGFDAATWNPNEDIKLTQVEVSEDENQTSAPPECTEQDESCEEMEFEDVSAEDGAWQAFEVRQSISEIFSYSDFQYGDVVNMTVAMYNLDDFNVTSETRVVVSAREETGTAKYKMSKRGVRKLRAVKNTSTESRQRLHWRPFKTTGKYAKSYQMKILEDGKNKPVQIIRGIKRSSYTVRNLDSGTTYRAIVRAVNHPNTYTGVKGKLSAWSSGYKWTTQ